MRLCLPVILFITLAIAPPTTAQEPEIDDFIELSLEDLLNMKVTVATGQKGMNTRESPGIISVVNAEEIQNSGARDLIDVLRLVPGFTFGMDVQGVTGIAIR